MTRKNINQLRENFYLVFEDYIQEHKEKSGKICFPDKNTLLNLFLTETERYIGGKFDETRVFSPDELEILEYAHSFLFKIHEGKQTIKDVYTGLKRFVDNSKEFYRAVDEMNCGEYYRLLDADKNINTALEVKTPLIRAIQNGQLTIVLDLVRRGAQVHQTDQRNLMPLYYAISKTHATNVSNQMSIVHYLLQLGAKTDNLDGNGTNAVSLAVRSNSPGCLKVLMNHHVAPVGFIENEQGKKESVLNYAIKKSYFEVFQILVHNGADVYHVDEMGVSPYMSVQLMKKDEYKKVLNEFMDDNSKKTTKQADKKVVVSSEQTLLARKCFRDNAYRLRDI